ncbi:MAG: hypothetical protein ACLTRS_00105 [Lachnospiraceae bacterium]
MLGVVGFIILAEKLEASYTGTGDGQYYLFSSFYLSILFVVIYGILIHLYRSKGKKLAYADYCCYTYHYYC